MLRELTVWLTALFVGVLLNCLSLERARALDISDVYLTEFSTSQTISGVQITFPVKIYLGGDVSLTSAPVLRIHAIADLGDLQSKIPAIVGKISLPSNNCGSYSANNPVVNLSTERLSYASGSAVFHADGSVAMWDCRENPVPNSELTTCWTHGLIKTKYPCVHTWPGSPIKNKLGTQPFSIDVPFGIRVVSAGGAVQLVPGQANLDLGGQYANITKGVLDILRVNVSNILTAAIQKAIDPSKVTAAVPKELTQGGFSFTSAQFVSGFVVKDLGLDVVANIRITTQTARAAAVLLYQKLRNKF